MTCEMEWLLPGSDDSYICHDSGPPREAALVREIDGALLLLCHQCDAEINRYVLL